VCTYRLSPAALILVAATALCPPALAQDGHVRQAEQAEAAANGREPGNFVVAPIPVLNPTLGAGLAAGAASLSVYDLGRLRPSVDFGLRYLLLPENRLNIGIDDTVGKDSDAVCFFSGSRSR